MFSVYFVALSRVNFSNGHSRSRSKKTEWCKAGQLNGMSFIEITGNHTISIAQTQSVTKWKCVVWLASSGCVSGFAALYKEKANRCFLHSRLIQPCQLSMCCRQTLEIFVCGEKKRNGNQLLFMGLKKETLHGNSFRARCGLLETNT